MDRRRTLMLVAAAALAAALGQGCAMKASRVTDAPADESRLITRAEIERSGAADGLEALRRAGSYLSVGERRSGDIRASSRGRSSFLISPQIMLVVDEVVMNDLSSLRDIRADRIEWIRIMSGREATPLYGTPAANGVLVVRTRIPVDR